MNFLLDPYVLAAPSPGTGEMEAEAYVENLATWSAEFNRKQHKFWLTYPIVAALQDAGQYPSIENFEKLNLPYGQKEAKSIAVNLFRACELKLMDPPYLDEVLKNGTVVCDESTSIILPPEIESRLAVPIAEALRETLSELAVSAQIHQDELAQKITFASCLTHLPQCDHISLDGRVLDIETDIEEELHAEWAIVLHPNDLDKKESEDEYLKLHWKETILTIQWLYRNWCASGKINPAEFPLPPIGLGKHFIASIQKNHYQNHPNILTDLFRNTIYALVGITERTWTVNSEHHPLFEKNDDHSPQRVRLKDGATAWRAYITRYKPQVRLHYWLLEDGSIELSKVGPHDDHTID